MFIRPCYRNKDGKRHAYWSLVESNRTERGPRQRVVVYLGRLDEEGRLGVQQAASGKAKNRQSCLPFSPEVACEDSHDAQPRWVMVNASAVRVENCVQFGGPWLALELIKKIGLDVFLHQHLPGGQAEIHWSSMALVLIISRLCKPSSELYIAEHLLRRPSESEPQGPIRLLA